MLLFYFGFFLLQVNGYFPLAEPGFQNDYLDSKTHLEWIMSVEIFENSSEIARPDFAGQPSNDLLWAINERQKSLTDNVGSYKKRSLTYKPN